MALHEDWKLLLKRTKETAQAYLEAQTHDSGDGGCRICADAEAVIEEYEHWNRISNRFPYDRYFDKSDMLVPKRHTTEANLTADERAELTQLKSGTLNEDYHCLLENLPSHQSIPQHYHIHLVSFKRPE